ncbi:MAG: AAA family ATPase, partial [Lachnospiraceae bacterium]|nr:AAA family ATPase [Lachnospiraceae bacterium]
LTPPPPAPAPAQKVVVVNRPQPGQVPPEGGERVPDVFAETGDMALSEPENDVLDFASVKLLDESIPFATRFAEAMKRKQMMMNRGVHFHKMFDDVITAVIENANPYMIGPSGCGKTFMVQQIAAILELESIDIGYINEEYDILGFQTANGGYSRPNFYRCYKYGKIAFCDELDNGNSRATVKLNSFLSNNKNAHYNFPNGERVARHPNFRIIAAGNTTGSGADINYNTREKIEESVQQRFTPIFVGYDNEVEKSILGNYNDWYEFVVAFRHATDAWSKHTHFSAAGIITTRDVTRIRKYLDNRSFTPAKILEYEFVQTKDPEYLAFLAKEIGAEVKKNTYSDACRKIYAMFASRVTEIRSGSDTSRLM